LLCLLAYSLCKPVVAPPVTSSIAEDGSSVFSIQDPKVVFKKAFWRHPGEDDQILHAERREWSTADGVGRWQWFIEVHPGTAMKEWLVTNPFSLAPARSDVEISGGGAPPWFTISKPGRKIFQKQGGGFTLFYSADGTRVFAMDSGYGFATATTVLGLSE
jgi:hypothetical protein